MGISMAEWANNLEEGTPPQFCPLSSVRILNDLSGSPSILITMVF